MDAQGGEWFDGKVVGITRRNADGSDRQLIAKGLAPFDELQLIAEPENPFDRNAIGVCTAEGKQIGYLEARVAEDLSRRLARGTRAKCFVRAVRESRGTYGVSFGLVQFKP